VAVHEDVLRAVQESCRRRGTWRFEIKEIVETLSQLNERTVRTHIASRCCVNAPVNHLHKWDYFRRVARGQYELLPDHRRSESATPFAPTPHVRDTLHVTVTRDGAWFVAECLEVPVVTQAKTMDEVLANLREALDLHLEDENRQALGLAHDLKLAVSVELSLAHA
jgi:predicted RNase H-like HicB family nuclease